MAKVIVQPPETFSEIQVVGVTCHVEGLFAKTLFDHKPTSKKIEKSLGPENINVLLVVVFLKYITDSSKYSQSVVICNQWTFSGRFIQLLITSLEQPMPRSINWFYCRYRDKRKPATLQ